MADSRPLPGPCTRTCTRRTPRFIASRPHCSAATVAANGVLLLRALEAGLARRAPRDRVAAHVGDRDQQVVERRARCGRCLRPRPPSCRAWRWAPSPEWPVAVIYFFVTFFLPAIARRGPFLVRALVCVRCPRTGRPRRWRMPRYDADVHQSLDVHRDLGAERALDPDRPLDHLAQPCDLGVREIAHPRCRGSTPVSSRICGAGGPADAEDVRQSRSRPSSRAGDPRQQYAP